MEDFNYGFTLLTILENSLKITGAFWRVEFERIFNYHKWCKLVIALAFKPDYSFII